MSYIVEKKNYKIAIRKLDLIYSMDNKSVFWHGIYYYVVF